MERASPNLMGLVLLLCLGASCGTHHGPSAPPERVRLILDTDMGNDVDDALALALTHALVSRGEAELLAITLTKGGSSVAYVDAVNTFYGRPDIPIGTVAGGGPTPEDSPWLHAVLTRTRMDGQPLYPHDLQAEQAPEAVEVLRHTLAHEADGAVVLVQVGFSTNLARLLDSPPDEASPLDGRTLVARKVRRLVLMAGAFPEGAPEFNVMRDVASARRLFSDWPTPLVASGYEVGSTLVFPAESIEHDFGYVSDHPIADVYRHYKPMPYDQPTWDLTAVLYAVRPDAGDFGQSEPGRIEVDPEGRTTHRAQPGGHHRFLTVSEEQALRVRQTFVELVSRPPSG
ncbi:nucleoside hydrolase [Archangium violaceum]|uniref:nucleoside hydrolase n=1 Tax=Archangium violaceum TaxID=83451 RepID=UPI0037C0C751